MRLVLIVEAGGGVELLRQVRVVLLEVSCVVVARDEELLLLLLLVFLCHMVVVVVVGFWLGFGKSQVAVDEQGASLYQNRRTRSVREGGRAGTRRARQIANRLVGLVRREAVAVASGWLGVVVVVVVRR